MLGKQNPFHFLLEQKQCCIFPCLQLPSSGTYSRLAERWDLPSLHSLTLFASSKQGTGLPSGSFSLLSKSCFHFWQLVKVLTLVTSNMIMQADASL